MKLLKILKFPNEKLNIKANIVTKKFYLLQEIINNMFFTMYKNHSIVLSATQVNINLQIIVIDIMQSKFKPLCLINPKIIHKSDIISFEEGCLSFPGLLVKTKRYNKITLKFLNHNFKEKTIQIEKLLGICVQHEIDHLNGITLYNHLSPIKKKILLKKIKKDKK